MAITSQEAWTDRTSGAGRAGEPLPAEVPPFIREVVEEIAIHARGDAKVDKRSGVSQRLSITTLENVVSNAERRALLQREPLAVPRVADIYASLSALTGKIELEYEGELKGAENVARELVRGAVATVFDGYAAQADPRRVIEWFDRGGSVELSDTISSAELLAAVEPIEGLEPIVRAIGVSGRAAPAVQAAGADFVLEGLCALKKISRTDEGRLFGAAGSERGPRDRARERTIEQLMEEEETPKGGGKKKYYN
jgi:magnesium chelatase subunit I